MLDYHSDIILYNYCNISPENYQCRLFNVAEREPTYNRIIWLSNMETSDEKSMIGTFQAGQKEFEGPWTTVLLQYILRERRTAQPDPI